MKSNTSLPAHADVVIVGSGFAGAATAFELARSGIHDIVLLEREHACGYHASGRNAALGRQLAESDVITSITVEGAAFLRQPPEGFSEVPLMSRSGSVLLVDTAEDLAEMAAHARRFHLPYEPIDGPALARRWPLLAEVPAAGGLLFPTDGVIDVDALLQGFVRGARARGARLVLDCEVLGFGGLEGFESQDSAAEPETVMVQTSRGAIQARCVVIAAGAWAGVVGRLAGARPVHYAPIRRHLFITEAVSQLDRQAPFVWHVGAHEFYVRPEGAGYLVSGCDETEIEPCDAVPAPDALDALAAKLSPIAPRLAELGIARQWACIRTFAPDRRPVIGWDAEVPWLFWVAGLGGHGATGSAAVGRIAAEGIRARLAQ